MESSNAGSTKMTQSVKKKMFIDCLEKNLGVLTPTFKEVGIHHQTYYNWMKKDKKFETAVENIKEVAVDFVESKLYKSINDGNVTAQIFYLKTKARHRGYIEKVENDITINALNFKFGDGDQKMIEE